MSPIMMGDPLTAGGSSGLDGFVLRGAVGGGGADARPGLVPQGHERRRQDGGRQPGTSLRTGEGGRSLESFIVKSI